MYVLHYTNKSTSGISGFLHGALDEVKRGNYIIREKLKHMVNKFLNASEFSAQEAEYYVLSISFSKSRKPCVSINPPPKRVLMLKSKKALPENSTNVFHRNILDHYTAQTIRWVVSCRIYCLLYI